MNSLKTFAANAANTANANEADTVRILLVDDHPMLRRAMHDLLSMEPDLLPAAQAASGKEALELVGEQDFDLILLDLNMPGLNGIETIEALRGAGVDAKIIIFSVSDDHADVVEALRAGADGYLLKDMEPEELVKEIRQAAHGRMAISPALTQILVKAIQGRRSGAGEQHPEFTKREKDVLRLMARGQSNKVIARNLDITEGTVKVHAKRLLQKLGVRSRTEAAIWFLEHNLE